MDINLALAANLVAVEGNPSLLLMSAPMKAGFVAISESCGISRISYDAIEMAIIVDHQWTPDSIHITIKYRI